MTEAAAVAPVYLPHGATVTSMALNAVDNDAGNDLTVSLSATLFNGSGDGSLSFNVNSSGGTLSTNGRTSTIAAPANAVVDTTAVATQLRAVFAGSPGTNLQLVSVRVNDTLP